VTAAERLSARLDELASAVHRAGLRSDASARLLEVAALAAMRALELELHVAERNLPRSVRAARRAAREAAALRAAA
jgi:hypothetical protein